MKYTPNLRTDKGFPSIPDDEWTRIDKVAPQYRKYLRLFNTDPSESFYILYLPVRVATPWTSAQVLAEFPLITAGWKLAASGVEEQSYDDLALAEIWVRQASGGPLTTLQILEGE